MDDDVLLLFPLVPSHNVLDFQLDTEGLDVDDFIGLPAHISKVLLSAEVLLLVGGFRPLVEELMVILLAAKDPANRLRAWTTVILDSWSQATNAAYSSPGLNLSQSWFAPLPAGGGVVSKLFAEGAPQPKVLHVLPEPVLSHSLVMSSLVDDLRILSHVRNSVKEMVV